MPNSMPKTGQGQWALGYREPLNSAEQLKRDSDGLDVRQRIIDLYSHGGFDSIDPADLRQRFKWAGVYTQRAQGIPGGKTAVLDPEELEDEFFMMRIRIDGGQLNSEQLHTIADISTTYARDTADITDRQNVQLHWVRVEDIPAIWDRLDAVGLSTMTACGDAPRVMLGCPLAGVAADEILDATPQLEDLKQFIGDRAFTNLPRKYKTSVSGCVDHCTEHEIDDIAFVGVIGPDGTPGFDLFVGGGLSTNPKFAERLGVFVEPARVAEVWVGVTSVFRDYGYRRSRARARLKFLMADWGPEKFREVLESEYLNAPLPDGPAPNPPAHSERDHVGVITQADGNFALGFAPRVGRVSGKLLAVVAEIADRFGSGRVRATTQQKLVMLDVAGPQVENTIAALAEYDLLVRPSAFRRGTLACTGIEFCKLAIVETKVRADELFAELERRLPDFDVPIGINLNGCPNSCARFQTADIGFKGSIVRDAEGNSVEGFQVHLGGHLGVEKTFGRKFRGLKVTGDQLADYCERVLRGFVDRREGDESFAAYVVRAEEQWLT